MSDVYVKSGEPIDVPDAEARLSNLNLDAQRIQEQLDDEGRRLTMSDEDYAVWRTRANDALYHKKKDMAYLRAYLRRAGAMPMPQSRTALGELIFAIERAMPTILHDIPPDGNPVIRDLAETFGDITGTYG